MEVLYTKKLCEFNFGKFGRVEDIEKRRGMFGIEQTISNCGSG